MNRNEIKTLSELFIYVTETAQRDVFRYRSGNDIVCISGERFREDVMHLGAVISTLVKPGSRIAFIGENSYYYLAAYFGTVISGNVPVLLDKALDRETTSGIVRDTDAAVILHSKACGDSARNEDIRSYCLDSLMNMNIGTALTEPRIVDPADICTIFHTSSSTGAPKIVPLTNKNIISAVMAMDRIVEISGTLVLCLPVHHVYGLVESVLTLMLKNVTIFINDSIRRLLSDIASVQPSILTLVPSLYSMLLRSLKGNKTPEALRALVGPKLKIISFGGAASNIDPSLMLEAGIVPYVGYGLTETAASVTLHPISATGEDIDNVGKPMDTVDIKLGSRNELLVKGDMVFDGYIHNESADSGEFEDGYFKTGDIGFIDKNGDVHITGRLKNLIILPNGENIPGEKLESYMYSLPYVSECIVKEHEGRITAFIYAENPEEAKANIAVGLKTVNEKLPLNQHITSFIFRDTPFPKTASQKIKRF